MMLEEQRPFTTADNDLFSIMHLVFDLVFLESVLKKTH